MVYVWRMKIGEALQLVKEGLKEIYDDSESSVIAQMVLEDLTGFSRTQVALHKDASLPPGEADRLLNHLARLQQHEPVQYLLGKAWFYGLELFVDGSVLIPRPETEELVDWIVADVKKAGLPVFNRAPGQSDATTQLKIMDVGTGSGCISLALKKALPLAEVWGCDSSEKALTVARRNGATLDIRVDFLGLDFLDETQRASLPPVDIIVSNPPYIPAKEIEAMHRNVVDYEPHSALFVPDGDPLIFYRAIIQFAQKRLHSNGSIYLEIHENLAKEVTSLLSEAGPWEIEIKKDMQGKERMVRASPIPSGEEAQV